MVVLRVMIKYEYSELTSMLCIWNASIQEESNRISIIFTRISNDMEEGYPGELHVKATYSITDRNELDMVFEAEGNEKPTIVNMTNHAYWNLSGNCKRSVDHHVILFSFFLLYRNYL